MRQKFRPFAPVVLDKYASDIFELDHRVDYSYMQFVVRCKKPKKYPAICHYDGTSRVQVLKREQNPWLYDLIEKFHSMTGCPLLLNTSLNIKGEPLVNNEEHAKAFEEKYNIRVFV